MLTHGLNGPKGIGLTSVLSFAGVAPVGNREIQGC
jgi:hypothetical protein